MTSPARFAVWITVALGLVLAFRVIDHVVWGHAALRAALGATAGTSGSVLIMSWRGRRR